MVLEMVSSGLGENKKNFFETLSLFFFLIQGDYNAMEDNSHRSGYTAVFLFNTEEGMPPAIK